MAETATVAASTTLGFAAGAVGAVTTWSAVGSAPVVGHAVAIAVGGALAIGVPAMVTELAGELRERDVALRSGAASPSSPRGDDAGGWSSGPSGDGAADVASDRSRDPTAASEPAFDERSGRSRRATAGGDA